MGAEANRQLTVSVEYPTGATALLSLSTARAASAIDLSIFGQAGAIYHTESGPFGPDEAPALIPNAQRVPLTQAIAAAMDSGAAR